MPWQAVCGHHGIFSLTPIWLLSVWGAWAMLRGPSRPDECLRRIVIGVTLVCLVFYLTRPMIDRNYGGVSCGFRWMFWFIPLWLICLVPAADRLLASRWGRVVGDPAPGGQRVFRHVLGRQSLVASLAVAMGRVRGLVGILRHGDSPVPRKTPLAGKGVQNTCCIRMRKRR